MKPPPFHCRPARSFPNVEEREVDAALLLPSVAVTVRQPWAALLAACDPRLSLRLRKRAECRTWTPGPSTIPPGGWFAVHAGQRYDRDDEDDLRMVGVEVGELRRDERGAALLDARDAFVAVARLECVRPLDPQSPEDARIVLGSTLRSTVGAASLLERWTREASRTCVLWILDRVVALVPPVPAGGSGALGVWSVGDALRFELLAAIAAVPPSLRARPIVA